MHRSLLVVGAAGLAACSGPIAYRSTGVPAYLSPSEARTPLVGGETDDNARLPEYLTYVAAYPHQDVPKLDLSDRRILTLKDTSGRALWDSDARVYAGPDQVYRGRTDALGRLLVPLAALHVRPDAPLEVAGEWSPSPVAVSPQSDEVVVGSYGQRPTRGVPVDVALVVDTTGSMRDEVERLRVTLKSVVTKLTGHPLAPRVRVGGVAYRDVGEAYVTRPFDFTSDLGAVQRTLDGLRASGGGDVPEAVQEALDQAVNQLSWGGDGTLRLLFLIGDAPPHFERGTPYTVTMRAAVERGITIVPVACSGIDDTGEFVFRQLAAVTLGRFLFVTYGGSTENHTGLYEENDLDLLMARAVWESLDAVGGMHTGGPSTVLESPYGPVVAPMEAKRRSGWGREPWEFVPGWPAR